MRSFVFCVLYLREYDEESLVCLNSDFMLKLKFIDFNFQSKLCTNRISWKIDFMSRKKLPYSLTYSTNFSFGGSKMRSQDANFWNFIELFNAPMTNEGIQYSPLSLDLIK